jgi:hypothetical protein
LTWDKFKAYIFSVVDSHEIICVLQNSWLLKLDYGCSYGNDYMV